MSPRTKLLLVAVNAATFINIVTTTAKTPEGQKEEDLGATSYKQQEVEKMFTITCSSS